MAPKVLVVLTSHDTIDAIPGSKTGWYLPEFAHPYDVLAPHTEIIVASPKGGAAPLDEGSVEAFKEDASSKEFLKKESIWKNTEKLENFLGRANEFEAIFYPGGHGPMYDLAIDPISHKLIVEFAEAGKIVSAVCHGPAAFVNVKLPSGKYLLDGAKVTGFANSEETAVGLLDKMPFSLEDKLNAASGGKFEKASADWGDHVVVERGGKLITGQNPASAASTGKAIYEAIFGVIPYSALSPTTQLPSPGFGSLITVIKLTSTTTCGLLLGSTIWASVAVMPSLISAPISTHSKLSVFNQLITRTNQLLPPVLAVATGSFAWLAWSAFSVVGGAKAEEKGPSWFEDFNTSGNGSRGEAKTSGFIASLGKAPTDHDAGITTLGGSNTTPQFRPNSTRNFLLGATALIALVALQVVIAPKNKEIQELVELGTTDARGKERDVVDGGEEGNVRIGEILQFNWVRVGLAGLAFAVSVWELEM